MTNSMYVASLFYENWVPEPEIIKINSQKAEVSKHPVVSQRQLSNKLNNVNGLKSASWRVGNWGA